MVQNYNSIIDKLNQFANAHLSLKRFKVSFFDQMDPFTSDDNTFPILYVVPNEVSFQDNIDVISFRVYCVDILQKDRSNEQVILNETLLILRDLTNWLRDADNDLNILNTPRAIPVNNFGGDFTTGWFTDFEIEASTETTDCSIPFSSGFQLTGFTCSDTYINQYLTCETLEECQGIIDIWNEIAAISGATGGSTFTGGTVTGPTQFTNGLTANTFSATTYLGLPLDIRVTGGTYSSGSATFRNNTGGTFTVSGFPIGGGGGQLFYLNLSETKNGNRYLSTTGSTASEQSTVTTIGVGATGTIASFQSDQLNTTLIPGGIWSFYLHSYKDTNNAAFNIFVEVYTLSSGGTQTLLFTTDPTEVTTNSPTPSMQLSDGYFSGCPITVTDSILAVVRATNTGNQSHTITFFSEGNQHYSYAISTLPTQKGIDIYVSGGTYDPNNQTLSLQRNDGVQLDIPGFAPVYVDPYWVNGTGTEAIRTVNSADNNISSGDFAIATGKGNAATGNYSAVFGLNSEANGNVSFVFGEGIIGNERDTTYVDNLNIRTLGGAASVGNLGIDANGFVVAGTSGGSTFTGGTVNGATQFTNGLTANTFSATTYQNLPTDIRVTGGTYTAGTASFTNNTGGTFNVTGFVTGDTFTTFSSNGTWAGPPADSTSFYTSIMGGSVVPLTTITTFLSSFSFPVKIIGINVQHLNNNGVVGSGQDVAIQIRNNTTSTSTQLINIQTNQAVNVLKTFETYSLDIPIAANHSIALQINTPAWNPNPTNLVLRITTFFQKT